ncbi:MAG TPA: GNAT family N-acetyltransferase [Aquabacterium sp.]|uniref:GNAT family N-acetyltransferase n=1 Tax=Aquabacterium sp. TaxID=1872578 RepID=UPI002E2F77F6|nr:GNAT family N-acetyltransferase [Aquabacterium sp.]HEX5356398.1 GNAT family N-acetyltransferase [Aquabacterium sp.]
MDRFDSVGAHSQAGAQASMVPGLRAHWHERLDQIPAEQWDELVSPVDGGTPFLRMALLRAMVDSGSACPDTGWQVQFLTLQDATGRIQAACPLFLKSHSYGEYVFDWSWADAHDRALARHGERYYPKLLGAVPFSPIPGPRLLVHPALSDAAQDEARGLLLQAMVDRCVSEGWSSAHVLFLPEAEAERARQAGWLIRNGVQFHWQNQEPAPYDSFEDFLASLQRDKRKKIQQERRKVREAGVSFEVLTGPQVTGADWAFFAQCYAQTYHERGQRPYLTPTFWQMAAHALPDNWVLFIASQAGERVASALLAYDPEHRVAYGRYWGAMKDISCLHFEACYYQPLAWCIEHGVRRFEGGAQGEHKLTRGLLPVPTRSAHWLRHEGLRQAVADFLMRETLGVDQYAAELDARSPFKPGDQDT